MKPSHFQILTTMISCVVLFTFHSPVDAGGLEPGPYGGRVIGTAPDRAELLISDEGIVTVTFIDDHQKPTDPRERTVGLFAQLDSGRKEIPFEKRGQSFVSTEPLPQPDGYILIVQIRSASAGKPVNTRLKYEMHVCGGCNLREYACTCEH